MTLDWVPTRVEIPLECLPNEVTGISVHGSDLVAVGTKRFAELLKLKAFEELPPPFVRGDTDASGDLNLTDPIATLNYLFLGDPPPPAPYPGFDEDPTTDSLTCARYP